MKPNTASVAAAVLVLAPSSLAFTQDVRTVEAEPQDAAAAEKHHYLTVEDLAGSDLRLRPTVDEDEAPVATIEDILVHTRTGELRWALVGCDGKNVLMPFSTIQWNSDEECFQTERSQVEVELLPEFDMERAFETGMDAAVEIAAKGWKKVRGGAEEVTERDREVQAREAATRKNRIENSGYVHFPSSFFSTGKLDELELYGLGNEEFGGVTQSIVNCEEQRVEFFVVSRGGVLGVGDDHYLIPYTAADICRESEDEEAEPVLYSGLTVERMESAVKYVEPEEGILEETVAMRARRVFEQSR